MRTTKSDLYFKFFEHANVVRALSVFIGHKVSNMWPYALDFNFWLLLLLASLINRQDVVFDE